MVVIADKAGRLQKVYQFVLRRQLPVEIGVSVLIPHPVEPYGSYLAVTGKQLGQLSIHERVVGVPVYLGLGTSRTQPRAAAGCIGAPPVDMRIVEVQAHILAVAGIGQLAHYIASEGCGIDDVVVGTVGIPHREALVVTRGKADVTRTGILDCIYPRIGIEAVGIERIGQFSIFAIVDVAVGHRPLARSEHRVESPVDEYAQLGITERLARLDILLRGNIIALGESLHRQDECDG